VNGAVVPPDDSAAFAQALIQLVTDPVKLAACGQESRNRVLRFTIDVMVERTLDAYLDAPPAGSPALAGVQLGCR
jgi:glycosyltransferase involved in cell wall biosynthesis